LHEAGGERTASLDQERARAHRGITDIEVEYFFRARLRAQPLERGFKRMSHNRLGQAAWRVMTAGAAALGGRLQDGRPGR
jgi:hypothetical protein